jgi:hypothetical protein
MTAHVHNPWTCPRHVEGCDCPDREGSLCNPYHVAGHCPDDLDVMPQSGSDPAVPAPLS